MANLLDKKEWSKLSAQIFDDAQRKTVMLSHADYGHFDLGIELAFGDDLSRAMEQHSPTVAWWATLIAQERHRMRTFEDGPYARYMAHVRQYAKLTLKALGDKDTLEAVRDLVVLMFSKHRDPKLDDLSKAAFHGSLMNSLGTATAVKKFLEGKTAEGREIEFAKFLGGMYWWEAQGIHYEDVTELHRDIQRNIEVLDAVLESFTQRGILLNSTASDRRSERGSLSTNSIRQIAEQVKNILNAV